MSGVSVESPECKYSKSPARILEILWYRLLSCIRIDSARNTEIYIYTCTHLHFQVLTTFEVNFISTGSTSSSDCHHVFSFWSRTNSGPFWVGLLVELLLASKRLDNSNSHVWAAHGDLKKLRRATKRIIIISFEYMFGAVCSSSSVQFYIQTARRGVAERLSK